MRAGAGGLDKGGAGLAQVTATVPSIVYSYLVDADGRDHFVFLSERAREWFGIDIAAAIEDSDVMWRLVLESDRDRVRNDTSAAVQQARTFVSDFRVRDVKGRLRWLRATSEPEPRRPDGSILYHGVMIDITELEQSRQLEMRQKEILEKLARGEPLRAVLDEICLRVESLDPDVRCTILLLEPKTRRVTFGAAPTIDRAYMDALEGLEIGPTAGSCGTAMHFGTQVISPDIEQDPKWAPYIEVARAFSLRACWSTPFFGLDGRVAGSLAAYLQTPRHPSAKQLELMATCAELSGLAFQRDQSQRALQDAELQLHHAQKLEAVGQLAGGVAHDFNNLLTVVQGAASLLELELSSQPDALSELKLITDASERAAQLTQQLLTFSRRQAWAPRSIPVQKVLHTLAPLLERTLGGNVELALDVQEDLPNVYIDQGQLEQVVLNLALNARDAMPSGGHLRIAARTVEDVDDEGAREPLRYVRIDVEDDGEGMTQAVAERAFEPFFSTKGASEGSGLGLSMVHGIIERAGGSVELHTEKGRGTRFEISLPSHPAAADAETERPTGTDTDARPGERILVVEDEPLVRTLTGRLLRTRGYEVCEVGDGPAALEVLRAEHGHFDLVLTDVLMPHMNGFELEQYIRAHYDVPVLLMSAYTQSSQPDEPTSRRATQLLRKPFDARQLARAVREAIDDPAGRR